MAVLCIVAAFAIALPEPALSADPSWRPSQPVCDQTLNVTAASLAVAPDGHATVLMNCFTDQGPRMFSAFREPGKPWSPASEFVPGPAPESIGPAVTVDGGGTFTALWTDAQGDVLSSRRRRTAAWSAATLVGPVHGPEFFDHATNLQIAANARGDVVAAWNEYLVDHGVLRVARRPAGGGWTAPLTLTPLELEATNEAIAISDNGDIVVVATVFDGVRDRVTGLFRPASGVWGDPDYLSAPGSDSDDPSVAIDAKGHAVATWRRLSAGKWITEAAHRPRDGYWQDRVQLSTPDQSAPFSSVAVDAKGRFTAAWNVTGTGVQASARRPDGTWEPPVLISAPNVENGDVQVLADRSGTVTVVWDEHASTVKSSRRSPGGAWSTPADATSGEGANANSERITSGIDARGNITITWDDPAKPMAVQSLDVAGPVTTMTKPTVPFSLDLIDVAWASTDEIGPVASSSKWQVRRAPAAGPFTSAERLNDSLTSSAVYGDAVQEPITLGTTYCFSAWTYDAAFHDGAVATERCSATPLDERALTASAGWAKQFVPAAYLGTAMTAMDEGRSLTYPVQAKHLALIATRRPGGGTVDVFLGTKKLKTISLTAATVRRSQIIPVASLPVRTSGKVRIVTTTDKPVTIEGLGVSAR